MSDSIYKTALDRQLDDKSFRLIEQLAKAFQPFTPVVEFSVVQKDFDVDVNVYFPSTGLCYNIPIDASLLMEQQSEYLVAFLVKEIRYRFYRDTKPSGDHVIKGEN